MSDSNLPGKDFIDVVNDDDVVIETRLRAEVHNLGLLHREVHVWMFDNKKNIYFQKSSANKSSAGLLDASIGGHVDAGENYLLSAVREMKEESGISAVSQDLFFLTKFRDVSKSKKLGTINNFIRSVYVYKKPVTDSDMKRDPNENESFQKFSLSFLLNLNNEDMLKFHQFVPTHELPHVLKYVKNL